MQPLPQPRQRGAAKSQSQRATTLSPAKATPLSPQSSFLFACHDGIASQPILAALRLSGNNLSARKDRCQQRGNVSLTSPDLVESGEGLFEFGIEQPHRVEDVAEACRASRAIGLPKCEDA